MPPSNEMRAPRPSLLDQRLSQLRRFVSNPSFSRLTSSGQVRQLDQLKLDSERLRFNTPALIAGRYEVVVPFQEGKSLSAVYLTKDRRTGEFVVVKLASDVSDLKNSALAIRRERRVLSMLDHPNIVGLRDSGCWEGKDFIVLDYVRGADLYFLLRDYARMPWKTARDISLQLCDALQAVHDADMIHSDVKPENIIISRTDGLKATLLDFGLAKLMSAPPDDELNMLVGVVGTVPYVAPEKLNNSPYDHRADIYSLGLVMYEMLSGFNPFDSKHVNEMVERIRNYNPGPPSTWVHLPEYADALVMCSISRDPEERFRSILEMRAAIEACRM